MVIIEKQSTWTQRARWKKTALEKKNQQS